MAQIRTFLPDGSLPSFAKAEVEQVASGAAVDAVEGIATDAVTAAVDAEMPRLTAEADRAKTEADRARDISNIDTSDDVIATATLLPNSKANRAVREVAVNRVSLERDDLWADPAARTSAIPTTTTLMDIATPTSAFSRIGFAAPVSQSAIVKTGASAWSFKGDGVTTDPTITITPAAPITVSPPQAVCAWIHISDVTGITRLNLRLTQPDGTFLERGTGGDYHLQPLVNGWNFIRFTLGPIHKAGWTGEQIASLRIAPKAPSTTATFIVDRIWVESQAKARALFVLDRGYRSFILNGGLADLRALGVPVTWAIDVLMMGSYPGQGAEAITLDEVDAYWREGDSISFHGWDGAPTATMTDQQRRMDTLQSIEYLRSRGYEGRMWRAAWVQNNGNPNAVRDLLVAQAQSNYDAPTAFPQASQLEAWPPLDLHNIRRWNISGAQGGGQAFVDAVFAAWKATRGFVVPYVHGIENPAATGAARGVPGNDITLPKWDYFVGKLETALNEGWLEAVTFEQLWHKSGHSFLSAGGGSLATYADVQGNAVTKVLP